jgi:2-keto-3-deoxy-L-rhamnonate aldolase RhmA
VSASSNTLRRRLEAGETVIGLWVTLESATVTEIAAELGFDWVAIETEHGPLGGREVIDHLRAARGSATSVIVRLPILAEEHVKRALDLGADGILVPLVRSAADVARALQFAQYPPAGRRTLGAERAVRWGISTAEYLATANDDTLVVPIIETPEAMRDIDAILEVPGLSAVFFGPGDLSAARGHPGLWEGPGVSDAIIDAADRARRRGVATGLLCSSLEDARARTRHGHRLLAVGPDVRFLIDQGRALLEGLKGPEHGLGGG